LELLKTFQRVNVFVEEGNDSMAIHTLEGIAERVPRLAITYLRMAEIYDRMASEQKDPAALNGAVLMYRRYLSLEMDASKIKSPSERLRTLETALNIAHFEDADAAAGEQHLAEADAVPVITSDEENQRVVEATVAMKAKALEQLTVSGGTVPQGISAKPPTLVETKPATPVTPKPTEPTTVTPTPTPATTPTPSPSPSPTPSPTVLADCDHLLTGGALPVSRLSRYGIEPTIQLARTSAAKPALTSNFLEGHWVSSTTSADNRESWIFDIKPFGINYNVSLSGESGVLQKADDGAQHTAFFNMVKKSLAENEFLSNTTQSVVSDQVEGNVANGMVTFKFESQKEYKPSSSIYSYSHTLLENLSTVIPFGNFIYKVGDSFLSKRSSKDVEATFTTESTFACYPVAEGVMECQYTMREKKTTKSGGTKLVKSQKELFYLYRTSADYVAFSPMELDAVEEDYTELFQRVEQDALQQVDYNYPLAYLYLYGIGTEQSDTKAVSLMTQLAEKRQCGRAMAWLATYFYHLSTDEEAVSSASLRRKYYRSSDYWMRKMQAKNMPEWYGLKADMLEQAESADSVVYFYKAGALKGDPFALYKMGLFSLTGRYHTPKNADMAQTYLQEAAGQHYADAYYQLALMQKKGIGAAADTTAYLRTLYTAIDKGSLPALSELSDNYMRGVGVARNFEKAQSLREFRYYAEQNRWRDVLALYGYEVE
jgi:TPR repeat protein